mmetsp:Transcript_41572/g.96104  ORF Transcript_41572/g.96104 Transcript_41572/m.96104 type:complete len:208 (-) Transcript_41572:2534-3157(-)
MPAPCLGAPAISSWTSWARLTIDRVRLMSARAISACVSFSSLTATSSCCITCDSRWACACWAAAMVPAGLMGVTAARLVKLPGCVMLSPPAAAPTAVAEVSSSEAPEPALKLELPLRLKLPALPARRIACACMVLAIAMFTVSSWVGSAGPCPAAAASSAFCDPTLEVLPTLDVLPKSSTGWVGDPIPIPSAAACSACIPGSPAGAS